MLSSALAAAIEQGEPRQVLQIARAKTTLGRDEHVTRYPVALAHALTGDAARAAAAFELAFASHEWAFHELACGKSIAVVGPGRPSRDFREEIDGFDLVVRTNFHEELDPRCGSRTDVSYYNSRYIDTRAADIVAASSKLKWLITTRGSDARLRELLPNHPGIRAAAAIPSLFLHASALAIPIILADLLRFSPARIKLFCVDFYCSREAYQEGYRLDPAGADSLAHSIRVHEPFSSFRFVQCLHAHGLCAGDDWVEQLLALRRQEYAERIQRLYGDRFVANENPCFDTSQRTT